PDTFELRISRTHIKFALPNYNYWWVDANIADLGWTSGVIQLEHHSYVPAKDCLTTSANGCPNTWHWDNVSISSARPFTLIRANQRYADATSGTVTFPQPAPANAFLRYAAVGSALQVSFDNGATWQAAKLQD